MEYKRTAQPQRAERAESPTPRSLWPKSSLDNAAHHYLCFPPNLNKVDLGHYFNGQYDNMLTGHSYLPLVEVILVGLWACGPQNMHEHWFMDIICNLIKC